MNRHPADLLSLAFGLIFAAVAIMLLMGDLAALSWEWIGPVVIIAVGAIVSVAARPKARASDES